jgi:hypothetical protein
MRKIAREFKRRTSHRRKCTLNSRSHDDCAELNSRPELGAFKDLANGRQRAMLCLRPATGPVLSIADPRKKVPPHACILHAMQGSPALCDLRSTWASRANAKSVFQ